MAPTQTRLETQVMDAEGKHPPNIEHGCGSLHVACMRGDLESVGILVPSWTNLLITSHEVMV